MKLICSNACFPLLLLTSNTGRRDVPSPQKTRSQLKALAFTVTSADPVLLSDTQMAHLPKSLLKYHHSPLNHFLILIFSATLFFFDMLYHCLFNFHSSDFCPFYSQMYSQFLQQCMMNVGAQLVHVEWPTS